jgi:hypothetical protein
VTDGRGVAVRTGTLVDATLILPASVRIDNEARWAVHRHRKLEHGYDCGGHPRVKWVSDPRNGGITHPGGEGSETWDRCLSLFSRGAGSYVCVAWPGAAAGARATGGITHRRLTRGALSRLEEALTAVSRGATGGRDG